MISAPLKSPDPPIPATARPMTRAVDDGAKPHTKEPISKMDMNTKNVVYE